MGFKEFVNQSVNQSGAKKSCEKDIRTVQHESLIIFDAFRKICEEHHLIYMMGGGSALGTVRHHGFIPWDDDIDINMPRKDFERFKTVSEELGTGFAFCAPNYKDSAIERFAKISLVKSNGESDKDHQTSIDIFVIENLPKNRLYRMIKGVLSTCGMGLAAVSLFYRTRTKELKKILCTSLKGSVSYYARVISGFFISFIPTVKLYNLADKLNQYKNETGYSGVPSGRKHYFGEQFPTEVYLPTEEGLFEGRKVPLEHDINRYLTNLYGKNYMELPPIEQRERHFG